MKTAEQIKGAIRNISKETGTNPNSLLQMCLFEGILEKLSKSKYCDNFILKGGLLISSLIGIDMRSTLDMDATIKGLPVHETNIKVILDEILDEKIDVEIQYELVTLKPIREDGLYEDFCATIRCIFGKINATLRIDITTGDAITPKEMNYGYPRILEDGIIPIMSYTLETILAEKFETITSRNITTTRARDFYDLYIIYSMYKKEIKDDILCKAIERTSTQRGTDDMIRSYKSITKLLRGSKGLQKLWEKYRGANSYAKGIQFDDTLDVYDKIGERFIEYMK